MKQYNPDDDYTIKNSKLWISIIEKHIDFILNLDHKTITNTWITDIVNARIVDTEYYGPRFTNEAKTYINYVKDNKIKIEED